MEEIKIVEITSEEENAKKKDPIQEAISNSEATMDELHCMTVAISLLRILERFKKQANLANDELATAMENLIVSLEQEIANQQDEVLNSAWKKLKKEINEENDNNKNPFNLLHRVIVYPLNGTSQECGFTLEEVIALVFAAVIDEDKEVYPEGTSTREERTRKFFECLIKISAEGLCPLGKRNDAVGTLDGIHPDVKIIPNLATVLHQIIGKHIHDCIFDIKDKDITLFREMLFAELTNAPRHVVVKDYLETKRGEIIGEAKEKIETCGIESDHFINLINKFLDNMDEVGLRLYETDGEVYFHLQYLWTQIEKMRRDPEIAQEMPERQEALENYFERLRKQFDPTDLPTLVMSRSIHYVDEMCWWNLIKFRRIFLKFHFDRMVFKETDPKEEISYFWKNIKNYYLFFEDSIADFQKEIEYIQLNRKEFDYREYYSHPDCYRIRQDTVIKSVFFRIWTEAFQKSKLDNEWIQNIFAKLKECREEHSWTNFFEQLQVLSHPEVIKKCYLSDDALRKMIEVTNEGIGYLDYDKANQIFLNALLIPLGQWTAEFEKYLGEAINYIDNDFQEMQKDDTNAKLNLKKYSYPTLLLNQLRYLRACYNYGKEKILHKPELYLPLPHLITSLEEIPISQIYAEGFIDLYKNSIKTYVKTIEDFCVLIDDDRDKLKKITELSGRDFILGFIRNAEDLKTALTGKESLFQAQLLGIIPPENLRKYVNTPDVFLSIFNCLEAKETFIGLLGVNFIVSLINANGDNLRILEALSQHRNQEGITFLSDLFSKILPDEILKETIGDRLYHWMVDFKYTDAKGKTALHLLLEDRNILWKDITPLLEKDPLLLGAMNESGDTPLHIAVRSGCSADLIEKLLTFNNQISTEKEHAPFDFAYVMKNKNNEFLIHLAVISQRSDVLKVLLKKNPELAYFIYDSEKLDNPQNCDMPLVMAIKNDWVDGVEIFLEMCLEFFNREDEALLDILFELTKFAVKHNDVELITLIRKNCEKNSLRFTNHHMEILFSDLSMAIDLSFAVKRQGIITCLVNMFRDEFLKGGLPLFFAIQWLNLDDFLDLLRDNEISQIQKFPLYLFIESIANWHKEGYRLSLQTMERFFNAINTIEEEVIINGIFMQNYDGYNAIELAFKYNNFDILNFCFSKIEKNIALYKGEFEIASFFEIIKNSHFFVIGLSKLPLLFDVDTIRTFRPSNRSVFIWAIDKKVPLEVIEELLPCLTFDEIDNKCVFEYFKELYKTCTSYSEKIRVLIALKQVIFLNINVIDKKYFSIMLIKLGFYAAWKGKENIADKDYNEFVHVVQSLLKNPLSEIVCIDKITETRGEIKKIHQDIQDKPIISVADGYGAIKLFSKWISKLISFFVYKGDDNVLFDQDKLPLLEKARLMELLCEKNSISHKTLKQEEYKIFVILYVFMQTLNDEGKEKVIESGICDNFKEFEKLFSRVLKKLGTFLKKNEEDDISLLERFNAIVKEIHNKNKEYIAVDHLMGLAQYNLLEFFENMSPQEAICFYKLINVDDEIFRSRITHNNYTPVIVINCKDNDNNNIIHKFEQRFSACVHFFLYVLEKPFGARKKQFENLFQKPFLSTQERKAALDIFSQKTDKTIGEENYKFCALLYILLRGVSEQGADTMYSLNVVADKREGINLLNYCFEMTGQKTFEIDNIAPIFSILFNQIFLTADSKYSHWRDGRLIAFLTHKTWVESAAKEWQENQGIDELLEVIQRHDPNAIQIILDENNPKEESKCTIS